MAERSFTQGLIYGEGGRAGALRHEDQESDWDASGYRAPRRFISRHAKPLRVGLFVSLILVCMAGWYYQQYHAAALKSLQDRTRQAETQLELAVVARVVRDYRTAQGSYPQDLPRFLARSLRHNKEFPPGTDFWGRPYVLEPGENGFVVRSAGADGRYGTRDDLTCQATVRG